MTLIPGLSTDSTWAPLRRLDRAGNRVAMTFDDGPDPQFTPQILDLLGLGGFKATFFVIASEAVKHPGIIRRILGEGHTLGSHGWSHRHPWLQTSHAARQEVEAASHALADLTGQRIRWFRPPHGALRPRIRQATAEQEQRIVLWSRSALDWGPWATAAGVARRLQTIAAGDIVLMHDGRNRHNHPEVGLQVLPDFFVYLTRHHLKAVPLG